MLVGARLGAACIYVLVCSCVDVALSDSSSKGLCLCGWVCLQGIGGFQLWPHSLLSWAALSPKTSVLKLWGVASWPSCSSPQPTSARAWLSKLGLHMAVH